MKSDHFFEKIENLILGHFTPGGVPTVFSQAHISDKCIDQTAIHEIAHKDLLSNTVYGMCLTSISGLMKTKDEYLDKFGNIYPLLIKQCFNVMEGDAIADELSYLFFNSYKNDTIFNVDKFLLKKPIEYRKASENHVRMLITLHENRSSLIDVLRSRYILKTISEICMDYMFIISGIYPDNLEDTLSIILRGTYDTGLINEVCYAFLKIPKDVVEKTIDVRKIYFGEDRLERRKVIYELKKVFIKFNNLNSNPLFFLDKERVRFIRHIFVDYKELIVQDTIERSDTLKISLGDSKFESKTFHLKTLDSLIRVLNKNKLGIGRLNTINESLLIFNEKMNQLWLIVSFARIEFHSETIVSIPETKKIVVENIILNKLIEFINEKYVNFTILWFKNFLNNLTFYSNLINKTNWNMYFIYVDHYDYKIIEDSFYLKFASSREAHILNIQKNVCLLYLKFDMFYLHLPIILTSIPDIESAHNIQITEPDISFNIYHNSVLESSKIFN